VPHRRGVAVAIVADLFVAALDVTAMGSSV
jgi:hypothetical protein